MKRRLPASFYNLTTLIGVGLALLMLALIVLLVVVDTLRGFGNAYMGLVTYIALPTVMLIGFLLAAIGIARTRRRMKRNEEIKPFPVLDFNDGRTRGMATWFGVFGVGVIGLSGFGSYQAYEYTGNNRFCGETCHNVMTPEYTAYQHSPHAEVHCKQCHVAPGAKGFVEAKMGGVHQLYAFLTNKVTRPVSTPVKAFDSTKETCERCHWTGQRYTPKLRTAVHYLSDEANTAHQISMLVKVGSTDPGKEEGIHAHMYLNSEVKYVATDRQRQDIAYVEMKDKNGKVTIYRDSENPISDADLAKAPRNIVNCADCHNRPAHQFKHPDEILSEALASKKIDATLPEVKSIASETMEKSYKTTPEALTAISSVILKFYEKNYGSVFASRRKTIDEAIDAVKLAYSRNYFPEMKASWDAHPNNLDHIHNKGCFRCHNNKLKSNDGKVITNDCKSCHLFVAQGKPSKNLASNFAGQEFVHPEDIGDAWKETPCMECHGKQEPDDKD